MNPNQNKDSDCERRDVASALRRRQQELVMAQAELSALSSGLQNSTLSGRSAHFPELGQFPIQSRQLHRQPVETGEETLQQLLHTRTLLAQQNALMRGEILQRGLGQRHLLHSGQPPLLLNPQLSDNARVMGTILDQRTDLISRRLLGSGLNDNRTSLLPPASGAGSGFAPLEPGNVMQRIPRGAQPFFAAQLDQTRKDSTVQQNLQYLPRKDMDPSWGRVIRLANNVGSAVAPPIDSFGAHHNLGTGSSQGPLLSGKIPFVNSRLTTESHPFLETKPRARPADKESLSWKSKRNDTKGEQNVPRKRIRLQDPEVVGNKATFPLPRVETRLSDSHLDSAIRLGDAKAAPGSTTHTNPSRQRSHVSQELDVSIGPKRLTLRESSSYQAFWDSLPGPDGSSMDQNLNREILRADMFRRCLAKGTIPLSR
jgi:hypothetical protein